MDKVSFSGRCTINKYINGKPITEVINTTREQDRYINLLRKELFGTDYEYGEDIIIMSAKGTIELFKETLGLLFRKEMPKVDGTTATGHYNTPTSIFVQNRTSHWGGDGYDIKVELSPENILDNLF